MGCNLEVADIGGREGLRSGEERGRGSPIEVEKVESMRSAGTTSVAVGGS